MNENIIALFPEAVGLGELLEIIRFIRDTNADRVIIFGEDSISTRIFARINGFTYVHGGDGQTEEIYSKRYSNVRCYEKGSLEHQRGVLAKEKVNTLYAFDATDYREAFGDMDIEIAELPMRAERKPCR